MKNLKDIISEKLIINKNLNIKEKEFTDEELRNDYNEVSGAYTKAEKEPFKDKYGVNSNKIRDIQLVILDHLRENRQKKKGVIGFNSTAKDEPEEHDIKKELQSFGLKPEIIGRYDRIIEMSPASLDVYQLIAKQEHKKLEESFHKSIVISSDTLTKIAEEALEAGLGGRYIKRRLFSLCENAIYSDCFTKEIIIDDCPFAEM